MKPRTYLDAIDAESERLVEAARGCAPDVRVPSCPRWTVADLLEHVGRVHRWAAANSRRSPDAEPWRSRDLDIELPHEHRARADWVRDGARELVVALDRPPETPAWTFVPPATVGFWQRRQAHETAIHRWDAQLAAGPPEPIDGELAVDGIDEVLAMIPVRPMSEPPTGAGETIHLQCTDRAGEWLVRLLPETIAPETIAPERGHAPADAAARAPASDLLLMIWGRVALDDVEVVGDVELLGRFQAAARV